MKAAVVTTLGQPPEYLDFQEPVAGDGETVVQVRAAPLSPIVRQLAAGRHYSSAAAAGFVPGVDGVGVDPDGLRVYFLFPKTPFGSMGERALASTSLLTAVPDALSDVQAAAIATGGLASWVALTRRAPPAPGSTVLINGATGAAGSMAVQIARHLGADKVIGTGRNRARLYTRDLDTAIALDDGADDALREVFAKGVDLVLDFVWGEPAARVLAAAVANRGSLSGEPRLRYVQLGTIAGDQIALRGDPLRSTGLELIGSGIGSVAIDQLVLGAGELLAATLSAGFTADVKTLPLARVKDAWAADPTVRYVLTPN
ncbi:zinc-binding dehydrogenase [uncultured Brevundimonas sp.]|uniref:quinone oxidoreductase family protein n=1 Tax=uncultured Brevundimonas sp. TaxID=213418 RepID=UPI0026350BF3|nr:zinc-binding dehydrogenase [uncultured Brevundimonas sp.]